MSRRRRLRRYRRCQIAQHQPVTVAAEFSMKQTLRLAAMPACGRTPSLHPNRGTCDLPSSGRADLESVGVLRTLHQDAAGCVVASMIARPPSHRTCLCLHAHGDSIRHGFQRHRQSTFSKPFRVRGGLGVDGLQPATRELGGAFRNVRHADCRLSKGSRECCLPRDQLARRPAAGQR